MIQSYICNAPCAFEGSFLFPLDSLAAVCGFEAMIDGVRTVAEIQSKTQARATYTTAIREGHTAQLLEQLRDDVFSMRYICIIQTRFVVTDHQMLGWETSHPMRIASSLLLI